MSTKGDLINKAYSRMRVSGLTRIPTPDDVNTALDRLESMAALWDSKNICTGYAFEDSPDPTAPHNLPREYWSAYESNLAMRLLPDYGKQPAPSLVAEAQGTFAAISADTARVEEIAYPNRMPLGGGNSLRRNRWRRFMPQTEQIEPICETQRMTEGDLDILTEHYDSWVRSAEDISSHTITSSDQTALAISADSLSTPDITYTVTAVTAGTYTVTIVVTSSLGRILTREKTFVVTA
jgi:hypothetical protein